MPLADNFATLFGYIIGGLVALYLISKIFEWLFLKRFLKNQNHIITAGSFTGFLVVVILWSTSPTLVVGFSLIPYFIAAILLPIIRIQWRKRKVKREIAAQTVADQTSSHSSTQTARNLDVAENKEFSQIPSVSIPTNISNLDEDAIYTILAEELESGKTDKGLWTRLFAECGGDEKQVKALYITRRVEKMMEAEKSKKQLLQKQETASLEQKNLQATVGGGSERLEKNTLINIKTEVKKRVWPKVLGGLVLVVVAGVGSQAYYEWNEKRVKPATGLDDVELSMRQEEVTAQFGRQPDCPITKTENDIKMSFMTSSLARELSGRVGTDCDFTVTLEKNYDGIYRTARICKWGGYLKNLPDYESSVLERLGKPDLESFSAAGTEKISNFKKSNLSLLFQGGKRLKICVMRDPNLVFTNAFKPS